MSAIDIRTFTILNIEPTLKLNMERNVVSLPKPANTAKLTSNMLKLIETMTTNNEKPVMNFSLSFRIIKSIEKRQITKRNIRNIINPL